MKDLYWAWSRQAVTAAGDTLTPCAAADARTADAAGEHVVGVLHEARGGKPRAHVGLRRSMGFAEVGFYDDRGRLGMDLGFFADAADGYGVLFHHCTQVPRYRRRTAEVQQVVRLRYSTDGRVRSEELDGHERVRATQEGELPAERLTTHWEPFPQFGDFASILREERDRSVDEQSKISVTWLLVPVDADQR